MYKLKLAYFLSHNGLGDNILSISALNYLSKYYEKIYFLCKDKYIHHIRYVFKTNNNIVPISFNSNNEFQECYNILKDKYDIADIFICGDHKRYLRSKITHPLLINYKIDDKNIHVYIIIIKQFYHDINLDVSIFVDYFYINTDEEIKELYKCISIYKIIFMHTEGSNKTVDLDYLVWAKLYKDEYLIICANKNMYNLDDKKYDLAQKYIKLPTIIHYYDIILNADEIYVIDSCMSSIVIGLELSNKLKASKIGVYSRDTCKLIN